MTQEVTPSEGQAPEGNQDSGATSPDSQTEPKPQAGEGKATEEGGQVFPESVVRELRQEAAKYRTRAQEVESELADLQDKDASDVEKANRKAERAETRAIEAESKLLRYEVAAEKEVPADAMDLLTGTTREALEAQAEKIIALRGSDQAKPPEFDGGAREPSPPPKSPEEQHQEFLSNQLFGGATTP